MPPRSRNASIQKAQTDPVEQVLAPQLVFASESRPRREVRQEKSNSASVASWILLVFACAGAMIPGLGFAMWLIVGPILFITLVLGIVAITKGSTANGVMIILASLVVVPLFVFFAPIVMTGVAVGAAGASEAALDGGDQTTIQETAIVSPEDLEIQEPWLGVAPEPQSVVDSSSAQSDAARPYISPGVAASANDEVQSNPAPYSSNDEFFYQATLVDPRGVIVLQSAPSITAVNVDKLPSGTSVVAAAMEGKWIKVRTNSGDVGYVRKKQLDFRTGQ